MKEPRDAFQQARKREKRDSSSKTTKHCEFSNLEDYNKPASPFLKATLKMTA